MQHAFVDLISAQDRFDQAFLVYITHYGSSCSDAQISIIANAVKLVLTNDIFIVIANFAFLNTIRFVVRVNLGGCNMDGFLGGGSHEDQQDTIAMFEQILEVMPRDQLALRTLYQSFLQLEEREKAFAYLNRLADVLLEDQDDDDVSYLIDQYGLFLDFDPAVASARLEALRLLGSGERCSVAALSDLAGKSAERDIDQEMGLAWRLFQEELLTQEEYSNLLTDLTESSARGMGVPVTVLHVLSDRGFKHIARIMHYICEHAGSPFVSLSGFELTEDVCGVLPLEFMQRRAAIPFGKLGGELMIGMLNPFNLDLVRDVEFATGRKCHVYLVESSEYDFAVKKMGE
jgi:tetratricopeptide (TPR) repeat protein